MVDCLEVRGTVMHSGITKSALGDTAQDTIPTMQGDFDGDGKRETAYLGRPSKLDSIDCMRRCKCKIQFFSPKIPDLIVPESYGGQMVNEGDLNQDGGDEIGFLVDWYSPCWRTYHVYTLRDGVWKDAIMPLRLHCRIWENEKDLVIPVAKKAGWVDVFSQIHHDGGSGVSTFVKRLKVAR
jgi:hypothetical protein